MIKTPFGTIDPDPIFSAVKETFTIAAPLAATVKGALHPVNGMDTVPDVAVVLRICTRRLAAPELALRIKPAQKVFPRVGKFVDCPNAVPPRTNSKVATSVHLRLIACKNIMVLNIVGHYRRIER